MFSEIETLLENIDRSTSPTRQIVPLKLLRDLSENKSYMLASYVLSIYNRGIKFKHKYDITGLQTYETCYELAKSSTELDEKLIYSLMFIGMFNKEMETGVKSLIKILVPAQRAYVYS